MIKVKKNADQSFEIQAPTATDVCLILRELNTVTAEVHVTHTEHEEEDYIACPECGSDEFASTERANILECCNCGNEFNILT